jgi:hypothetical protein
MQAQRGRGGLTPSDSQPRRYTKMGGLQHVPAALLRGKCPTLHFTGGWVDLRVSLEAARKI